ncbi:MAG: molybdopterin-dependent oxidoreductase [Xanthobacteraceae bacterium]
MMSTGRLDSVRAAEANGSKAGAAVEVRKNVCTHCSVGCTVIAEVENGVWTRQQPAWGSPINRGTHCAKGAAIREVVHGGRRLKYPLKLEGGEWKRISWDQAITEIGDKMLAIREKAGADSVYFLGSAKYTNEGAYLFRKFGLGHKFSRPPGAHLSFDHRRRRRQHLGLWRANQFLQRSAQCQGHDIMGGNPAEAHPISVQHILAGKELNRANLIVIDPRFTRTAAHATEYVRIRPGTDIPVLWGMLWHIFENGWEDKEFIRQRVYDMDDVRKEVAKWTPDEVERVSGVPGHQLRGVAEKFAKEKPATLIWCMGQTQKTVGTANVRASCIALLATGNVGGPGLGANIFRGHTNVQGATDPDLVRVVSGPDGQYLPAADLHFARDRR